MLRWRDSNLRLMRPVKKLTIFRRHPTAVIIKTPNDICDSIRTVCQNKVHLWHLDARGGTDEAVTGPKLKQ